MLQSQGLRISYRAKCGHSSSNDVWQETNACDKVAVGDVVTYEASCCKRDHPLMTHKTKQQATDSRSHSKRLIVCHRNETLPSTSAPAVSMRRSSSMCTCCATATVKTRLIWMSAYLLNKVSSDRVSSTRMQRRRPRLRRLQMPAWLCG